MINCFKLDIEVHPTLPEPVVPPPPKKKCKWRWPWRINMVSKPKWPRRKYQPPPPETFKVYGPVEPGTEFRADHLSRPLIRYLAVNKNAYAPTRGPKYVKAMDKKIDHCWNSIYNHYKKQIRRKRLNRLKRLKERKKQKSKKDKEKEEEKRKEHLVIMAQPKKPHPPEKIVRKRKPLEALLSNIEHLAEPAVHKETPPKQVPWKIKQSALNYEITENILKMSKPTERNRKRPSIIVLGQVTERAKRFKCTPRLEVLSKPSLSAREAKKHEDDKYDPFVISPNALKYKPSPRILELAKPSERD